MEYNEAKQRFIQAWGTLGANWGINKAMAQIHALLLIATEPMSAEDIMAELQMSRGNVNMNLRALIDWGIVKKEHRVGERREYFSTGKNVWDLAKQVSRERRRREIEPILNVLTEVQKVSGDNKKQLAEFKKVTSELYDFSLKVDGMIEKFTKSDQTWFYKLLMKL
jgi:DNA-binding transcriptional regulator GbsR (MarR family)